MITRRSTFAVFAAALAAPVAAAFAQAPAAGGLATTPGNSEGTPSGGAAGVVSRTQVGPSTRAPRRRTRRTRHIVK